MKDRMSILVGLGLVIVVLLIVLVVQQADPDRNITPFQRQACASIGGHVEGGFCRGWTH